MTVETGFCSFCDRTRGLRREERQLGALVRTVTSCESCHRVLSSTIGVADHDVPSETEPAKAEPEAGATPRKRATAPKAAATAKPKAAPAKAKSPAKGSRTGK